MKSFKNFLIENEYKVNFSFNAYLNVLRNTASFAEKNGLDEYSKLAWSLYSEMRIKRTFTDKDIETLDAVIQSGRQMIYWKTKDGYFNPTKPYLEPNEMNYRL